MCAVLKILSTILKALIYFIPHTQLEDLLIKDFVRAPAGIQFSKQHMNPELLRIRIFILMPHQIHSKYGYW